MVSEFIGRGYQKTSGKRAALRWDRLQSYGSGRDPGNKAEEEREQRYGGRSALARGQMEIAPAAWASFDPNLLSGHQEGHYSFLTKSRAAAGVTHPMEPLEASPNEIGRYLF